MKKIILVLHPFDDEQATRVADQIRSVGDIKYTDASGSDISLTVGSITIEQA